MTFICLLKMMIRIFPFIFVLLWSSAFITTKPIIDNSDPFAALAFRFALVALGFFLFSVYSKQKILVSKKNFIESLFSGVLFGTLAQVLNAASVLSVKPIMLDNPIW